MVQKAEKIWMDGKLVNWDEANVHILTHTLHYGCGVFEGIRAYECTDGRSAVYRLTEHMQRLIDSAHILNMKIPYSLDELVKAVEDTLVVNKMKSAYIRPLVFIGDGVMGVHPGTNPIRVAIATWPWGAYLGEAGLEHGVRAKISSFRRIDANTIPTAAKACGQYLNSILAKIEVVEAGYEEAILLNVHGFVADGAGENIFAVKQGTLYTPPTSAGALEGITRGAIIELAEDFGIPCVERDLVRTDLYLADEAFFTGTAAEVVPIREVDDRMIGEPGPITKKLQQKFFEIAAGRDGKYDAWLEYVN